jgi:nickel transport protein
MKRFIHWGLIASLVGGGFWGASLVQPKPAIAIAESEIIKHLETIPMFVVINSQKQLIPLGAVPNPKDKTKQLPLVPFFLSADDAQAALDALKKSNPTVGNAAQVVLTSMSQAYECEKKQAESNAFACIPLPTRQQIDFALNIYNQGKSEDKKLKEFPAIPLFFATGDQTRISHYFFRKQDLENWLAAAKKQDAKLAAMQTQIRILTFQEVMRTLRVLDEPFAKQIQLIPSQDDVKYANSLSQPQKVSPN